MTYQNKICISCGRQRDEYTKGDPNKCHGCQSNELLAAIWDKLPEFHGISLWDVNMPNFPKEGVTGPQINLDMSALDKKSSDHASQYIIPITPKNRNFLERLVELYGMDKEYSDAAKFLVAWHAQVSSYLMNSRMECYLINKYSKSIERSKIVIANLSIQYADWSQLYIIGKHTITVTGNEIQDPMLIESINDSQTPKITDFDVKYIIEKLKKCQDNECLFRGINGYFNNNDGIASSNYRRNPKLAYFGILQKHEEEIVGNLIDFVYYDPVDVITCLTDLRHSGMDTNIIDFSTSYRVSLLFACSGSNNTSGPRELLILPKSILDVKREVDYPILADFILKPTDNIRSETSERAKTQSSVFVYCHKGYLARDEYSGRMENLLIDENIKDLLLKHSDYREQDVFPDFMGFLQNIKNFQTKSSNYVRPALEHNHVLDIFVNIWKSESQMGAESILANLKKYDIFLFLDVEISDYARPVIATDYMLTRNENWKHLGLIFDTDFWFPNYTFEDAQSVKYILACNGKFNEKFNEMLKTKVINYEEFTPVLSSIYVDYMSNGKVSYPQDKKIVLSISDFENVIS